ncbi:MAG: hypothetical protein AAF992_17610 [Bacteroidota bacterium]
MLPWLILPLFSCSSSHNDSLADNSGRPKESADTTSTREIVVFSTDNGITWQPLSAGLPANTQASFIAEKGDELVLATDNQGIFITENNKANWKNIGQDLPTSKINALHVADEEIYVGLYRQGIYKSSDDGNSWQSLNENLPNLSIQTILKFGEELLVGTDIGIFKTPIGQTNWKQKSSGTQVLSINEFNGRMIAGTSQGVLLSVDQGETWNTMHNEGAIHYTAYIDSIMYAFYVSGEGYRSTYFGNIWTKFDYLPREGGYIYELAKVGNTLLMSNNYGLFESTDSGNTWQNYLPEERFVFFDFLVIGNTVYGITREADEYRNRKAQ